MTCLAPPPPPSVLVVRADGLLRECALVKAVTVVGRDPGCDIVLEDAAVSARHFELRFVDRLVQVADLVSTNGTRINGRPAILQMVKHADVIHAGGFELRFSDYRGAGAVPAVPAGAGVAPSRAPPAPAHHVGSEAPLALRARRADGLSDTISLTQANTLIGDSPRGRALIVRRAGGHFVARFGASLRLNSRDLDVPSHPIGLDDVIEVGGCEFRVVPHPDAAVNSGASR